MNFFPLFLARRLIASVPGKQAVSRASRVCFCSIMLGALALTTTAAIMQGLRQSTNTTLQNIHPDIIMHDFKNKPLAFEKINQVLKKEFSTAIPAITPFSEQQGVIQGANNQDITHIMSIQGIDPTRDQFVRSWSRTVIKPLKTPPLTTLLSGSNVMLGKALSEELCTGVGDTVVMLFPSHVNHLTKAIHFRQHKATVSGIFSTGIDELDSTLVITSLNFFGELFPQAGISSIGLKKSNNAPPSLIANLKKRFNLDVYGWQELYPALEAALELETTAFMIIIALVMLIANMNIMSLLSLFVSEKKHTLAILQSMGIGQSALKKSLLIIGCAITTSAQLCGITAGWLLSILIDHFKLIPLPDLYYSPYLTAHLTLSTALLIFIIGTGVGIATSWWALSALKKTTLALALKRE